MASGARIDDNDISGKSLTFKEYTGFIADISSAQSKAERQESSELLAYDSKRLKEKRESGSELTNLEQEREKQVADRVEKITLENLHEAKFDKHKLIYAAETKKRVEDVSIEEVVRAKGNAIIEEAMEVYPKIKQAFHGMEDKLASLVFHNPKAIHEHHENIDQLKIEAEKAHQRQKEYEKVKEAENQKAQTKEEVKTISTVTNREAQTAEKSTSVETVRDKIIAEKAAANDKVTSSKLEMMKAKKASTIQKLEAIKASAPVEDVKSSLSVKPNVTPISPDLNRGVAKNLP